MSMLFDDIASGGAAGVGGGAGGNGAAGGAGLVRVYTW